MKVGGDQFGEFGFRHRHGSDGGRCVFVRYIESRNSRTELHHESVDFCDFVAPTEKEQEMRAVAVERVSEVVKSIWPSCQVVILETGCQAIQDGLKALATRGHVAKSIQVAGSSQFYRYTDEDFV